jgi:acyl-CoA synthetase (AMP-forming)/AMP-acid ligase II
MLRALAGGGTVVTQAVVDIGESLALLGRERVTNVVAWPATAASMAEHPARHEVDLRALRGGVLWWAMPPDRRPPDPGLTPAALGMTETAGPHCAYEASLEATGVPPEHRGTSGRVVPGVEVRVVDAETGTDQPDGTPGEIWVRGYSLMSGMHKRERGEVFDADGWYHTGDLGLFRDGWMHFVGRASDMIKTRGMNVAPAEVEAALAARPEVLRAFVVGVPDATAGQLVVALLVARAGDDGTPLRIDGDAVRAELKRELSSYKLPAHVFAIDDADVPWLSSQKVDRRRLAALAAELVAPRSSAPRP